MAYRTVDWKLWDDPKVKRLRPEAKLLFVYLITNRHTHLSGIYVLADVLIEYELGLGVDLAPLWDSLQAEGLAYRDTETDTVWVRSMMRYQGSGEKNYRAAANQLKTLHNSFLIIRFLKKYPEVREYVRHIPFDTLSDTPSEVGTQEAGSRKQDQAQEQEEVGGLPESLDTPEFRSTWGEWIVYRREIRKALTATTVSRQMKKLERWGSEKAVAALELSMENGWTGVFDPDEKKKGKATRFKPKVTDEIAEWADSTIQDYS